VDADRVTGAFRRKESIMKHRASWIITAAIAILAAGCGSGGDGAETADAATTPVESASPTLAPAERSPIDGEYRMTLSRQDILKAGLKPSTVADLAGSWRVTFSFGYAQQFVNLGGSNGITADGYQGSFTVDGTTLSGPPELRLRWRLDRNELILFPLDDRSADPVDVVVWTTHRWERI
jgi:hypothetical protein